MIPEDMKKRPAGGRPASHSIMMSVEQFEWMQRKLGRKVSLIPHAKDSSSKLKRIIQDLESKFSEPQVADADGRLAVKLNRHELEVLIELVNRALMAYEKALAAYSQRAELGENGEARKLAAQQYLTLLKPLASHAMTVYGNSEKRRG